MRGQLEIYSNFNSSKQRLVYEGENTIVDGAGELIADIMTFPTPSLAQNSQLSSLLDASNYTIQAISFGKASEEYNRHAHVHPLNNSQIEDIGVARAVAQFEDTGIWEYGSKIAVAPYLGSSNDYYPTSAYPGGFSLPSYTSPTDTALEKNTVVSGVLGLSEKFADTGINSVEINNPLIPPYEGRLWIDKSPFVEPTTLTIGDRVYLSNGNSLGTITKLERRPLTDQEIESWEADPSNQGLTWFKKAGGRITFQSIMPYAVSVGDSLFTASHLFDGLSSIFPTLGEDFGQNLNMLAWGPQLTFSSLNPTTEVLSDGSAFDASVVQFGIGDDSVLSSLASATDVYWNVDGDTYLKGLQGSGVYFGCYPQGSGTAAPNASYPGTSGVLVSSWTGAADTSWDPAAVITSGVYISLINSAKSMDIHGYLGKHYCVSGNIAPTGSNTMNGLVISALSSTTGESLQVTYSVTMGSGDLGCANLYGGITTAGLWALDVQKSVQGAGNLWVSGTRSFPPFAFDPITNRRRYKLFSKKVFNQNICSILNTADSFNTYPNVASPQGGHQDLTFVWRLFFS